MVHKVGFFEESPGVKSSTRLNSFILLFFLMGFDIALALTTGFVIDYNFILFNIVMLTGAFTPKYLNKLAELKFNSPLEKKEIPK
jgi:hypothetical protein